MPDKIHKLGKYTIKSVLGQGAMGVVYEGMDPDIGRIVAIKVLHSHLQTTPQGEQLKERFRREAQAAARCIHPNIVTIFELGSDQGQDFIVIEYVQGEELKFFLDNGHGFSQDEALHIASEVLRGLDTAHQQGVIHRDIKPANIMLLDNGGVKVADFGVARLDESDLTLDGNMVGTPVYMSPEGLRGKEVDQRADLYSTGMVLLEILTGQKPTPQQLYGQTSDSFLEEVFAAPEGEGLSEPLRHILRRALADDREQRFANAREFLDAIRQANEINDNDPSLTLAETVVSQRPLIKEAAPGCLHLEGECLQKLEKGLTSYIGPLAKTLIKRSLDNAQDIEQLLDTLSNHISEADEREQFRKLAKRCLCGQMSTDTTQGGGSGAATVADKLSPSQLKELTEAFAFHVGPLAQQLINRHARKVCDYDTFCDTLADAIPNADERQQFLKRIGR